MSCIPSALTALPNASSRTEQILRHCTIAVFFLALCWFAHFSQSAKMGFYEDDHFFAVPVLNWTAHDPWVWSWNQIRHFPMPQGRPVGFILGRVLPYLGYRMDGIPGMYLLGWWIFTLNSILFYYLLRRCLPAPLPMIGAIAFVFFPADTTRPFLCHAHILQPSVTFMLLACHLYLAKRWRWRAFAYFFAACSLLSYETALLPFFVFPFLEKRWDLEWLKRFGIHLASLALLISIILVARRLMGESRVVTANGDLKTVISEIHDGTHIGIATALNACKKRATQGFNNFFAHPQSGMRIAMLIAGLTLGTTVMCSSMLARTTQQPRSIPSYAVDLGRATIFALAALSISYLFCFTHFPPDFEEGRLTSTHLAATFPIAVLMAVVAGLPLLIPPRSFGSLISAFIVAGYFPLLYSAAIDEQAGYISIWEVRKVFWTQVLDLCPDVTDRTLIVCDGGVPQPAYYMGSNSWSDFMVIYQCYQFPEKFSRDPMAFCYRRDAHGTTWQRDAATTPNGKISWKPNPFGQQPIETLDDGNLILLHIDDVGHVTRDRGTVTLAGQQIHLRELPNSDMHCPFPMLPLYSILTGRPGVTPR